MECGFHIRKHTVMNLFFKCVYVWGTLHAGYLLNGMLNSALQREKCKRWGRGGRRRIQKDGKAAKCVSLEALKLNLQGLKCLSYSKEEYQTDNSPQTITCWGVWMCKTRHHFPVSAQWMLSASMSCIRTLKSFKKLADNFCRVSKLY